MYDGDKRCLDDGASESEVSNMRHLHHHNPVRYTHPWLVLSGFQVLAPAGGISHPPIWIFPSPLRRAIQIAHLTSSSSHVSVLST